MSENSPRTAVPAAGQTLENWLLEQRLGRGGMGVVFRATHQQSGIMGALKVFLSEDAESRQCLRRHRREVLAMAQMRHPGVVKVLQEALEHEPPFFVMELLEGGSLASRLETVSQSGEPGLGPELLRRLALEMAEALSALHARRILHRDIKPGNILFDATGAAKLTDFGIAKPLDQTALTLDGRALGTWPYMAPEIFRGAAADERGDLYQLGVTLYEATTGRLPFDGLQLTTILAGGEAPPFPPFDAAVKSRTAWLEPAVRKLMAPEPEDRFQTAEELRLELEGTPRVRPLSASRRTARPAGSRPVLQKPVAILSQTPRAWFVAAGLLAATVTLGAGWMAAGRSRPEPAATTAGNPPRRLTRARIVSPALRTPEGIHRQFEAFRRDLGALDRQLKQLSASSSAAAPPETAERLVQRYLVPWSAQAARARQLLVRHVFPPRRTAAELSDGGLLLLDLYDACDRIRRRLFAAAARRPTAYSGSAQESVRALKAEVIVLRYEAAVARTAMSLLLEIPPDLRESQSTLWCAGHVAVLALSRHARHGSELGRLTDQAGKLAGVALGPLTRLPEPAHPEAASRAVGLMLAATRYAGVIRESDRLLSQALVPYDSLDPKIRLAPAAELVYFRLAAARIHFGLLPHPAEARFPTPQDNLRGWAVARDRLLSHLPWDPRSPAPAGTSGPYARAAVECLAEARENIESLARTSELPIPREP